jgi:UDP-4-amino-4,6-dideoxy-N-acetyl-beta-L-altrosamine transaminase
MSGRVKFSIPYGKQSISQNDIDEVAKALKDPLITTGPKVKEFEERVANYCGAKYCVAVSNGTAALHLSSLALLSEGDMVLTTPNSFLATSNSILYAKAKPVFVDIADDGNIDLNLCEDLLKRDGSIKAIYAVSFSGRMVDQEALRFLREKYKVKILEDNAHAIGAMRDGVRAGSCQNSDLSIFSFHPVKNMTTGEGGAITTNDRELYDKLLTLRNHGIVKSPDMAPWEYEMRTLGFNYRLTDFQAALGISQIERLDWFLSKRREIAKRYDEAFASTSVKPLYEFDSGSAYHLYVVRVKTDDKRALFERLIAKGVGVQLHYMPINRQPYYKSLGYGDEVIPVMDRYYEEALSLPIYPLLGRAEQEYVIESLFGVLDA